MLSVIANKNFVKPRRIYLSNRGARSKPIEICVADIRQTVAHPFFVVKTGSKVAQFRGLAMVLATLIVVLFNDYDNDSL